jgi:hypothetical protein
MRHLILLAGAAALAAAGPAVAKPPGHGHGNKAHSAAKHGKSKHGVVVSDRFGRMYALNARGGCPPGLDKKGNGCMPPGQAKKLYNVGQRFNRNFGNLWTYNQIPDHLRSQYTFDPNDRYYYGNGYLYQVDPRTMLVERVISALLR